MNKFNISMIAVAVGIAFSTGVMAQGLSKDEYKDNNAKIADQYKLDKAGCDSMAGNKKDICIADAKGKENIARAELEDSYKPGDKTRYQVLAAKAEAAYAVAKEKCDDKSGNAKDVCLKEAKSAEVAAKADAKARTRTSAAGRTAGETSADARKVAAEKKRDAEYAVAKEKCDDFSGDAKGSCMAAAKARYGKS